MKPYAPACDRNKEPILGVLREIFTEPGTVLEIGSGTGQHAVYMGQHLAHLTWLTSDRRENHSGIRMWLDEAALSNVREPLSLNVTGSDWPVDTVDGVFSANTAHIMSWPEVVAMFRGVGNVLRPDGCFCLYGPFNKDGDYTSESNRAFDASLKAEDANMGLRDIEDLQRLGEENGLEFAQAMALPSNNMILIWRRLD